MAAPGPRVARPGLEYGSAGPSGPWPQQRPSPPNVPEAAASIVALVQAMQLPRVILMGHSWAASIALAAAAQLGERISHLVLIGTASPMTVAPALLDLAQNDPAQAIALIDKIQPQPRHPG